MRGRNNRDNQVNGKMAVALNIINLELLPMNAASESIVGDSSFERFLKPIHLQWYR